MMAHTSQWFKKFLMMLGFALSSLLLLVGAVHAVEVNTADQASLETVRGLGPSKAKAIIDERKKNGPFKDSADLHSRVKGVGEKTVERLMNNGLTVNGQGTSVKSGTKKSAKSDDTKTSSQETKTGRRKTAAEKAN